MKLNNFFLTRFLKFLVVYTPLAIILISVGRNWQICIMMSCSSLGTLAIWIAGIILFSGVVSVGVSLFVKKFIWLFIFSSTAIISVVLYNLGSLLW